MMMEALSRYWALLESHWLIAGAIGIAILFAAMILWFQLRSDNDYDFLDTLKSENGKASQDALIVYFMAALAAWYVIVKTIYPAAGNAGGDLVNILMIFLVYRLGKKGVESWEKKAPPPPAPPAVGDNIGQQVVNATPVPDAPRPLAGSIKTMKA